MKKLTAILILLVVLVLAGGIISWNNFLPEVIEAKEDSRSGTVPVSVVLSSRKISDTAGNFTGTLADYDFFSIAANIGDLDGDGVSDLAVGAPYDPENAGAQNTPGAVWILFMNNDGTVKGHQKITEGVGGMTGLANGNAFGLSLAAVDLNNDGQNELIVGAPGDQGNGASATARRGAIWVLFLNTDGTVASTQKFVDNPPQLAMNDDDNLGSALANVGDVDGDNVPDIAVGASGVDWGAGWGESAGAAWVLFMNTDGTVKGTSWSIEWGSEGDRLGSSLAGLGDLDGDSTPDMAGGVPRSDTGGNNRGGVYVFFLNTAGSVKNSKFIAQNSGNFTGILDDQDFFGSGLANIGDVNKDGVVDLAVGAGQDDDGGVNRGAVWMLFLNADGTVKSHQKISTQSGFTGLNDNDIFGNPMAGLGDTNGDGYLEVAVGAPRADDGGTNRGAVWILSLSPSTNYHTYLPLILKNS